MYGRYLELSRAVVFGGVGQDPQVRALARGVDILVATPGRLLDLMGQGFVRLDRLEVFVLDEADRMLDMGFIHDVRRVDSGPAQATPDAAVLGHHADPRSPGWRTAFSPTRSRSRFIRSPRPSSRSSSA